MKRAFSTILRALALLLLIALLSFAFLALQIDRLWARDDAQAADAIVVLGARVNADGSPGSDLTSRTYHAVDLWLAGYAPHIICTGGFKNERLSAAAVCRRFAIELGVPAERIYPGRWQQQHDRGRRLHRAGDGRSGLAQGDPGQPSAAPLSGALALSPRRAGCRHQPDEHRGGSDRATGAGLVRLPARRPRFLLPHWTGGRSCRRNGSPAYSVGPIDCSRLKAGCWKLETGS